MKIAVIGGGINGIMTAWELCKHHHDVTLFEKNTLMSQTSSASSKLLHGGLRYLENYEFRLVKEATGIDIIKLEVIGDTKKTLYPDVIETLKACEVLAKEGFTVMAYTNDDPIMAKRLEDAGAAAVMPLAAPIGSGLGVQNRYNVVFVKDAVSVPVIVDAGIGTASDAAVAMELGADGVLTNTAIAQAKDPIRMAEAMKYAVIAGREAYKAGRIPKKPYATASSPLEGLIEF